MQWVAGLVQADLGARRPHKISGCAGSWSASASLVCVHGTLDRDDHDDDDDDFPVHRGGAAALQVRAGRA